MFRDILFNLLEIPKCSMIRSQQDIIKDKTYKKIYSHNFLRKERVESITEGNITNSTISFLLFPWVMFRKLSVLFPSAECK